MMVISIFYKTFLGGFYDLDSIEFKYLEDLTLVVAMGPPS
jgi:hypothetical protein